MMWTSPPDRLQLGDHIVDIWRLSLDRPAALVEQLHGLLCDGEKARAARFYFDHSYDCYTLTRGVLRILLGDYLGLSPQDVSFCTGEHGKPALSASVQSPKPVEFNVSHSGDFSLLAFARNRRIGVDLEQINARKSLEGVARHHFSPSEAEKVLIDDDKERLDRFYRCWTRKEAYMKATGAGLSLGLETFAVSVDDRPRLLWTEAGEASEWEMREVAPASGYVGAVCVEATEEISLQLFDIGRSILDRAILDQ